MSEKPNIDFESEWASFMAGPVREELQKSIDNELTETSSVFDILDGTHAKWNGEMLGILTVFRIDDLISLLAAWEEAADGNWLAQKEVLLWLEKWMSFITECVDAGPQQI